jgi:hypothetical protein
VLIFALALTLCLAPTALAADQAVTVAQSDTVEQIQAKIQAAITAAGGSGKLTVSGSKKGTSTTLTIVIPARVTVVWKADYDGVAGTLIYLGGTGTFEVASGIISTSGENGIAISGSSCNVIVNGGTVTASGDSTIGDGSVTIRTNSGAVTVTSGNVISTKGDAIFTDSGDVTISGTAIVQANGDAYHIDEEQNWTPCAILTDSGTITLSGGEVTATGLGGIAVRANSGEVNVIGGTVSAHGDYYYKETVGINFLYLSNAINTYSSNIIVSGGTVESFGKASTTIVSASNVIISGNAIVRAKGDYDEIINHYSCAIQTYIEGSVSVDGNATVQASGLRSCAIETSGGDVTVSDGKVESTGDGGNAIHTWTGNVTVSGNAIVRSTGDTAYHKSGYSPACAISTNTFSSSNHIHGITGNVIITGGTVESIGKGGIAIYTYSISKISGGVVRGSTAIHIAEGGVAAYLVGTCIGDFYVYENLGLVVQVASLNAGTVGTNTGLIVKAGVGSASWIAGESIEFVTEANTKPNTPLSWMGKPTELYTLWWSDLGGFAPFIQGFENNTFRRDTLITREQFAAILFRIKNPQSPPTADKNNPSFNDVAPARWSYDAIEWANKAGIIEAGNFRPAEALTRAEMAVMLVRANNLTEMAENTFSDLASHTAKDDILKAVKAKIFAGYPDGSFKPDSHSTRAEAVTALIRYLLGEEPTDAMWQSINLEFSDVARSDWAYKYIVLAVSGY